MHIHSILERLREEKLFINLKKCSFVKKELVYLGFVVSVEGLKIDLEKVKVILEWLTPRFASEVRSFHGLASFYRNFSNICAPLTETMREDRKELKWTTRVVRNFELLKKKVIEQPVLALLDFNKVF